MDRKSGNLGVKAAAKQATREEMEVFNLPDDPNAIKKEEKPSIEELMARAKNKNVLQRVNEKFGPASRQNAAKSELSGAVSDSY